MLFKRLCLYRNVLKVIYLQKIKKLIIVSMYKKGFNVYNSSIFRFLPQVLFQKWQMLSHPVKN